MPTEEPKVDLSLLKKIRDQESKENSIERFETKRRPAIPPALPLLPKSQIAAEPVKTGAPIPFLKLAFGNGECGKAIEKQGKQDKKEEVRELESSLLTKPKRTFKNMFSLELNSYERNPVVYSRYAKEPYDPEEKVPENCFKSCIINIKKLISENDNKDKSIPGIKINKNGKKVKKDKVSSYYKLQDPNDRTLIFESRFESGNLNLAMKIEEDEYNLLLQNDINTNGHTQWFYFRVGNTFKGKTIKFNVLNLCKPDSLYNYGMKVL